MPKGVIQPWLTKNDDEPGCGDEGWTGWARAVGGKGPLIVLYTLSPDCKVLACTGIRLTVQPLACTPERGLVKPLPRREVEAGVGRARRCHNPGRGWWQPATSHPGEVQ